jgi:hypothetical protein
LGLALLPGDYDADRDVDAVDYSIWRNSFGQNGFGRAADNNGNQFVDAGDFVAWRKSIAPGSGAVANLTVPEPACFWMLVFSSQIAITGFSRRRSRP